MRKRKRPEVTEPKASTAEIPPKEPYGDARAERPSEAPAVVPATTETQSDRLQPPPAVPLSAETVALLRHLIDIRKNWIVLPTGRLLHIRSINRMIYLDAQIQEDFPRTVPIYSVEALVQQLSYFKKPVLHFEDTYLTINDAADSSLIAYHAYTDPSLCEQPREVPSFGFEVEFDLNEDSVRSLLGLAKASGANELAVRADGRRLDIVAQSRRSSGEDQSEVRVRLYVGEVSHSQHFTFIFKLDYATLLPGSYHVAVSKAGLIRFSHQTRPIVYHICLEATRSTYIEDHHNA